jgi:hypothetical protein
MTFKVDTSGRIACTDPSKPCICHAATWDQLSPFVQGYVEAMFSTRFDGLDGTARYEAETYGKSWRFSDVAPETLARIMEDCERFLALFGLCDVATSQKCGRIFWEQRSDPVWCSSLVERFPPLTPYLGGDGKIYLRAVESRLP